VGVVGSGLMGSGIIEVLARAGLRVTFAEGSDALVDRGQAAIERSVGRAVERGKLDRPRADGLLARIEGVTDLDGLAGTDLIIEAATEQLDAKLDIFRRLGRITRPEVILASNTSSIPIIQLAVASDRPANVIGMHFFNPPPVMKLLELTPAETTSVETFEFVRAFGTEILGKTCVRSSDEAGFIVNRLLIPYLFDAIRLHERDFTSKEDIDTAIVLGLGHPMGPLALADLIGLDTVLSIGEVLHGVFPEERFRAPALLGQMVADGKLGRKSGEGFYRY
jgi:3-hydroxybutyryl-CoA dehydrogenase